MVLKEEKHSPLEFLNSFLNLDVGKRNFKPTALGLTWMVCCFDASPTLASLCESARVCHLSYETFVDSLWQNGCHGLHFLLLYLVYLCLMRALFKYSFSIGRDLLPESLQYYTGNKSRNSHFIFGKYSKFFRNIK